MVNTTRNIKMLYIFPTRKKHLPTRKTTQLAWQLAAGPRPRIPEFPNLMVFSSLTRFRTGATNEDLLQLRIFFVNHNMNPNTLGRVSCFGIYIIYYSFFFVFYFCLFSFLFIYICISATTALCATALLRCPYRRGPEIRAQPWPHPLLRCFQTPQNLSKTSQTFSKPI